MPSSKDSKAIKHYQQATSFYDVRKNPEALEELKKAIERDKNFVEAFMLMGYIYSDMGMTQESIAAYTEAVKINPDFFPKNFSNLAKEEMKNDNAE